MFQNIRLSKRLDSRHVVYFIVSSEIVYSRPFYQCFASTMASANPNPVPDQVANENTLQTSDLAGVFRIWDSKHTTPHYDPVPVLTRYAHHVLFHEFRNSTKTPHFPLSDSPSYSRRNRRFSCARTRIPLTSGTPRGPIPTANSAGCLNCSSGRTCS